MAIPQKQIQGTVLNPDGSVVSGGSIEIDLSVTVGTVPDDATSDVYTVGGKLIEPISAVGVVDFFLVPNDLITPAGTVWVATYHLPGHVTMREVWSVLDGAGIIQIGDIVRSNAGAVAGSQKFLLVTDITLLPIAAASLQGYVGFVAGAAGAEDIEYICMKGYDDVWRWIPRTLGGGA